MYIYIRVENMRVIIIVYIWQVWVAGSCESSNARDVSIC